jgi:hypothetical protein
MKEIQLTNGGVALVDDEDFGEISCFKWYAHKEYGIIYAWRHQYNGYREYREVKMHRQIMKAKTGEIIDHADSNGLNNQKSNLRFCSFSQNNMNSRISRNNVSGFKGVSYHRQNKRWRATINKDRKQVSLGCYGTPEAAALAYNRKATELFGEFARPNVI